MKVQTEFERDFLTNAMASFDASRAPRTEDLLIELEDQFGLCAQEARWLYDAIIFARPYMDVLKYVRVIDSCDAVEPLPEGSRIYGEWTYIIGR